MQPKFEYQEFLKSKVRLAGQSGFSISLDDINPALKLHNKLMVKWAVEGGRRALFASFGLHKTVTQLEAIRCTLLHTGGRGLIIAPLGVRQEFKNDAVNILGWTEGPKFIRSIEEADETGIYITNYETVRDGKLDPRLFQVASLDEASVLRGFGGSKTFREFMRLFTGDGGPNGNRRGTDRVNFRFVATATPSPNDYIELLAYADFLGVMDVSQAKAQPLDADILTPSGFRKMGTLKAGDEVIAVDGTATKILGIYPQGKRPIYKVTMSDGSSTECDAEHLWLTRTQYERNNERRYKKGTGRKTNTHYRTDAFATVKSTQQIACTLKFRDTNNHSIPICNSVSFEKKEVLMDPWLMGLLIGDGHLRKTNIVLSTADEWIVDKVKSLLPSHVSLYKKSKKNQACFDYSFSTTGKKGGSGYGRNTVLKAIQEYGLIEKRSWQKRIPQEYLINDTEKRVGLLRGLMDADGTIHKDGSSFSLTTTSIGLTEDVIFLVQSLGGIATYTSWQNSFTYKGVKKVGRTSYKIRINLPNEINPFSLPRKADRVMPKKKWVPMRYITSVEPVGEKAAQCIAIDHPSRLYLTNGCIVTHNTRFFKRDSTHADKLTLHKHKEKEFWLWVASWALFVTKPSDLTGNPADDEGYILPELDLRWHELPSDHSTAGIEKNGQGKLFKNTARGLQDAAREKRESLPARIAKLLELRQEDPAAHRIIWHDLESERYAIEKAIPTCATVYGSQDLEERERIIAGFSYGEIPEIGGKASMIGSGTNLQRYCHWSIYLGIGFKFNDFIQSIHRLLRFLQTHQVRIDLIYTEAEREVRRTLERKWQQHIKQVTIMTDIIKEFGLSHAAMAQHLTRAIGVERIEIKSDNFHIVNNDAVLESRRLESDSIGLILTSIPFSTQYEYSPNYSDFGHSENNEEFFVQMDYLTPELFRSLMPGRIAAIHVKDRIVSGGMTGLGFQTVYPFHLKTIEHYCKHGFGYLGMKTIVTDVVRENNQTYRLGWTEQCKDASKMGVGMPEYLLLFRKPPTDSSNGYADVPVTKSKKDYSLSKWQVDAHGFTRSSGNRPLKSEEIAGLDHDQIFKFFRDHSLYNIYDFEYHVEIGESLAAIGKLPTTFMLLQPQSWSDEVWTEITRMRTLNGSQHAKGKEMHLCPMQIDLAQRVITQMSMKGEKVLDPFGGLMTVPSIAVELGRYGVAFELNHNYFLDGAVYCKAAEQKKKLPTLFDLIEKTA